MDPEATLSSTDSTDRADFINQSLLAVPFTIQDKKPGRLEEVEKNGAAHYTEEDCTIPETLTAWTACAIHNTCLLSRVKQSQVQKAHQGEVGNITFILPVKPGRLALAIASLSSKTWNRPSSSLVD